MRPAPPRASFPPRSFGLVIWLALPLSLLAGCRDDVTPPPAAPSVSTAAPLDESPDESPSTSTDDAPSSPGGRPLGQAAPEPGARFRLSYAEPVATDAASGPRSTLGEPIEGEDLAALVARLPELPESAAVPADYRMPPGPPRPAIAGETIEVAFPPPADPSPPPAGNDQPLMVERFQPEGDIPIGSHLTVTFSRPFAPLATNAALDALDVPVVLDPRPEGRWRWIGTRTLLFEPEPRFPMATEYSVEVPAGVEAADGATLSQARRWTFRTPPVGATGLQTWVSSPDRAALLVVTFDQAIEREAIAPFVSLADPHADIELRPATASEIAAHEGAQNHIDSLPENRWVALVTPPNLPPAALIDVRLDAEAPSAEGPRTGESASSIGRFHIYDRLIAKSVWCGRPEGDQAASIVAGRAHIVNCDPYGGWSIEFNNPIDGDSLTPGMVTVAPDVPGLRIEENGSAIQLRGVFTGQTRYTVRVAPGLKDDFEQVHDEALELAFETGNARPALVVPGSETLILDPAGPLLTDPSKDFFGPIPNLWAAKLGSDSAFIPNTEHNVPPHGDIVWFAFDDRGIYRPGERVAVKGFVRYIERGLNGDVDSVGFGDDNSFGWSLEGWDLNTIASGAFTVDRFGAYDFQIDLPNDAPIGHARLSMDGRLYGGFAIDVNIAEFRRPEFEVEATAEDRHVIVGERGHVGVEASYFAGGALPGAEVRWLVHAERSDWRPAGWSGFVFGRWQPWWMYWGGIGAGSGDRAESRVPLDVLPEGAPADLVLSKEGPGRLCYRLGLRYAPQDLDLPADERGFAVLREYEAVDDPGDVRRRADGGWAIRAGARVRVRLRMDAQSSRYHVALVDPLPAGFEAINPELLTTEDIPAAAGDWTGGATGSASRWSWWGWRWYEHEAYRDHQVEVFAAGVPAGIHRYDYVARATTPGTFVVPPAKAEEMYHPETFGRSGTDRVVIE